MFLKTHGEIRTVQDKLKLRQFMPSKPALCKILKSREKEDSIIVNIQKSKHSMKGTDEQRARWGIDHIQQRKLLTPTEGR